MLNNRLIFSFRFLCFVVHDSFSLSYRFNNSNNQSDDPTSKSVNTPKKTNVATSLFATDSSAPSIAFENTDSISPSKPQTVKQTKSSKVDHRRQNSPTIDEKSKIKRKETQHSGAVKPNSQSSESISNRKKIAQEPTVSIARTNSKRSFSPPDDDDLSFPKCPVKRSINSNPGTNSTLVELKDANHAKVAGIQIITPSEKKKSIPASIAKGNDMPGSSSAVIILDDISDDEFYKRYVLIST